MKKKLTLFLLTFFVAVSPVTVCASENTEQSSDKRTPITDSSIYDELVSIFPEVKLYQKGDTLGVDISEMPLTEGVNPAILHMMKFATRVLSCDDLSTQFDNIVIGYWKEKSFMSVTISEFKNTGDFYSKLSVSSDDETFEEYANRYYNNFFGYFDLDYQSVMAMNKLNEKMGAYDEIISVSPRDAETFFTYTNWGEEVFSTHLRDQRLELTIQNNYDDDTASGSMFRKKINRCIETYANLYNKDSTSLPFNSFEIMCIGGEWGSDDDRILCNVTLSLKSDGSWQMKTYYGGNNFKNGFIAE